MATLVNDAGALSKARMIALDHYTVASVDLVADYLLYQKLLGAKMGNQHPTGFRTLGVVNASIERLAQGRPVIFFLEICGRTGFGLFLQDHFPAQPQRLLEGPRYGYAVAAETLDPVITTLEAEEIEYWGPFDHEPQSPFAQSVYVRDRSQNCPEFIVMRESAGIEPLGEAGLIPLAGWVHQAVDCTDLDAAEEFYTVGLGLVPFYRGEHPDGGRKSVLRVKDGGIVTLQEIPEMPPRAIARYRGDRHIGFTISQSDWDVSVAEMERRKTPTLPNYPAGDGTLDESLKDYYVSDPCGNNVQFWSPPVK